MNMRRFLAAASERDEDFIVCGGYAVNAYHVIRKTGDIDLLVRARDASSWKGFLKAAGYTVYHETPAFVQLEPPAATSWPVDLMLVDDHTFDLMRGEARRFRFGGTGCWIPSIRHLIAMKLHALKQTAGQRSRKDAIDIVELAEKNGIDLRGADFRRQCDRFADRAIYDKILQYAADQDDN
jgi:hypothetical protein